jgi:hypothetical protein
MQMRATHKGSAENKRTGRQDSLERCHCLIALEGLSKCGRALGTDSVVAEAVQRKREQVRGSGAQGRKSVQAEVRLSSARTLT